MWEGLEVLALTFPVLMWVMRTMPERPPVEAVTRALTIVDDHFGYNRVLRSRRLATRVLWTAPWFPRRMATSPVSMTRCCSAM